MYVCADFYYNKLHADISPIRGHHGYNAYKGQSFHWLHHRCLQGRMTLLR
eukprot:COSAG02_NODE_20830_length_814_cov_0.888112_2_plen_49_part_01